MNNQSPLVPLGSLLEQKNKGRARVKIAVFFVLAIHGIGLMALLLQGCRRDDTATKNDPTATTASTANTPETPSIQTTNQLPPENPSGQAVVGNTGTTPGTQQTQDANSASATSPGPGGGEYTIAKGDTYSTIASHFHVTVKAIEDANVGVDPKRLQIGKKLHIPPQPLPTGDTTAKAGAGTTTETTNGEKTYTVKSGDMLITIAKTQGTTVKAIRAANNLTTDNIKVGQKLKIPNKVVETAASNAPATR
jgi:LysM repeat protein